MGLKILHSADWHLDSPFASFSPTQREFLRQEQRKLPGLAAELCRREQCDLVLLSGDLFDGPYTRESLDALRDGLYDCGVPVFIAPGNHDFCAADSPWLKEHWPDNVYIFTGSMGWVELPSLDCRIYGAGYTAMDCPPLLEGFRAEGDSRYCIALLHADPTQAKSPYCPVTAAQVRESGLDYLALGHIHQAGSFRAGNTLCLWPGCPMGRGWDETGEKGFAIVKLEESAEAVSIPSGLAAFHDLTAQVEVSARDTLDAILPPAPTRDFYRVTLTGTCGDDISDLAAQYPHIPNLTVIDRTETPRDLWADAGEDSLRGVFFRMLRDAEQEADPENARILRLAAELSRQIMDGREVMLP